MRTYLHLSALDCVCLTKKNLKSLDYLVLFWLWRQGKAQLLHLLSIERRLVTAASGCTGALIFAECPKPNVFGVNLFRFKNEAGRILIGGRFDFKERRLTACLSFS